MIFGEMPRTRAEADASTLNGRSRLVMKSPEPGESLTEKLIGAQQSGVESKRGVPDPLIQAFVGRLPKPNAIWSIEVRAKWLRAAATIFDVIYKADDRKEAAFSTQTTGQKAAAPSVSTKSAYVGIGV